MTKKRVPIGGVGDFRRRAEEKARADQVKVKEPLSPDATQKLLHELQVHQIELEMQNEEFRRVQGELEVSQARYFNLYDLAPVGYLTLSEKSQILEANLTSADLLGVAKSKLLGQPITRFILPDDRDLFFRHRRKIFEAGTPQAFELRLVRPDGSQFWVSVKATAAQDAGGAPVFRAAISDVTARKRTQEALEKSEARYRSYLGLTGQLGWTTDADGKVVEDLPIWRQYTGQSCEEIQGWGWSKALHPDDVERSTEVWRKAVAGKQRYETEYRVRRHDGVYRDFLACGVPTFAEDGSIREWVGTCIDVTERKQVEGRLRRLAQFPEENPNPVMRLALDGTLLYANPPAKALLAETAGRSPSEVTLALRALAADAAQREHVIEAEIEVGDSPLTFWFSALRPHGEDYVNLYARDITGRKHAETELEQSRARLAWVLAATGVGLWLNELPLGGLNWDQRTRELFFLAPEEQPTIALFWSRLHPDDREPTRLAVEAALRDRTLYAIDHRAVNPNTGEIRWIRSVGQATYAPDGTPLRFDGVNYDITQRKQAEAALYQAHERLALAQTSAGAGMWDWDMTTGRLEWSCEMFRLFGLDPVETAADLVTWRRVLHPADREAAEERLQAAVLNHVRLESEYRILLPSGEERWISALGDATYDLDGRPLRMSGICIDVTARKRAEAALRVSEERYRSLIEQAADGIFVADAQGRYLDVNPAGAQMLGYSHDELLHLSIPDVIAEEEVPRLAGEVAKFVGGAVVRSEWQFRRKDGSAFTGEVLGRQLADGRLQAIVRDITERKQAEASLREANERYELVLAGAGGAIWDWDVAHHRVMYSSRWKAMRGFAEHEVSDAEEEWSRSIHPEDAPRVVAAVQAHFEGKTQVFAEEYRVRRKDGSWFWIADRGLARRDASGRVIRMAGSEVDITDRKQAEQGLRESELFYRQTLESIPGMVFTTRPDGYCDYQSQQWVEFTGIPMSEHLGDGWNKLLHPDDRPRAFAAWQAAVEGRAPYDLEYRVRRRDGEYAWFKVRGRPIRNAAGEIVRWFGTVLNIDDLVRAKAALERSERLYRGIGESIDYGIWICEPDGRNTYASESFLKLVGLTQEQCSSFGWGEVLHPDDAERTIAAWKECVRTGGTWDIEHRFRGVDGQWHPILARGVPVRDEAGRVLCWAGINLDISRLKGTEEQLKSSLHEKEVLLQEIHHRVKNNLQVISSLINLQTATQTDPALQTSLGDVRDRVRAMALVHEKLYQSGDLARLNFADYATSLLQHLWRAHSGPTATARLRLDLQLVALPVDTAVPCGLILNELASNALKHAFPNQTGGEVTVGLSQDAVSRKVYLRVADNGRGLPPNLNWRESPSLGLRLVHMLAQQLHGAVEISPGPGTEFRISFPVTQNS